MLKVTLDETAGIAILQPDGAISKEDFSSVSQKIDPYIESNETLKGIIIHTRKFPGWDSLGSWLTHLKFVKDHQKYISKIAFSTDSAIGVIAEDVANHFVSAEIKTFPFDEIDASKDWIVGG